MRTRQLGTTNLHITPIGFGAWALGGGGWEYGWGPQDDRELVAAIRRAIDLGINWIDTAAVYGLGRSEEAVAKALDGASPRPYVVTKCSMVWDPYRRVFHDISPASLRREVDDALPTQVEAWVGAAEFRLSDAEVAEIEAITLG